MSSNNPTSTGYYLSRTDRDLLQILRLRYLADKENGSTNQNDARPIWVRIKSGTPITPMRGAPPALEPGTGLGVQWRTMTRLDANEDLEPVLRKLDDLAATPYEDNQEYATESGDNEIAIYNYTPFEIFECSWVPARLALDGGRIIDAPPTPVFFAKATETIDSDSFGLCDIVYAGYDTPDNTDPAAITWMTGIQRQVLVLGEAKATDDEFLLAQEAGGKFVALGTGGGGGSRQLTATTAISAASGLTLGTGTGDLLELSNDGGSLISFGGSPVPVRSPFEESIALGSMLTCYFSKGFYIVIQASCPETP